MPKQLEQDDVLLERLEDRRDRPREIAADAREVAGAREDDPLLTLFVEDFVETANNSADQVAVVGGEPVWKRLKSRGCVGEAAPSCLGQEFGADATEQVVGCLV